MLITMQQLGSVYDQIKARSTGGNISTMLLVANTCDALCACKILTTLLERDFILFALQPVAGFDDVDKARQTLAESDFHTVIFLDCAGTVDVFELVDVSDDRMVLVIDSHRPYNLANVYAKQVLLITNGGEDDDVPSIEQISGAALEDEDENDSDNDSDNESSDEDDNEEEYDVGSRRERSDNDRSLDENDDSPSKRARGEGGALRGKKGLSARAHKRACRRAINTYYRGTYHSRTCASILYSLAFDMRRDSNNLLWMAIVSLTDQLVHDRIDAVRYTLEVGLLQDEVLRHNADDSSDDINLTDGSLSSSRKSLDTMRIQLEEEFRFMLMRHWTLYDSMFHSTYIASKLMLWTDRGREKLQHLFAKMGVPLQDCRQKYTHMSSEHKATLPSQIRKYAPDVDLHDITYSTFSKTHGFRFHVTAADVVHCVYGLLQSPLSQTTPHHNFYTALDALTDNESGVFEVGIERAKDMQRHIMRKGMQLLQRRTITRMPSYRYVVFDVSGNDEVFLQPLTLGKLALFLMEVDRNSAMSSLPMVVGASGVQSSRTLIAGATGPSRTGAIRRNKFGDRFYEAAKGLNADVKFRGFDSHVMDIPKRDIADFWTDLQLLMQDAD